MPDPRTHKFYFDFGHGDARRRLRAAPKRMDAVMQPPGTPKGGLGEPKFRATTTRSDPGASASTSRSSSSCTNEEAGQYPPR